MSSNELSDNHAYECMQFKRGVHVHKLQTYILVHYIKSFARLYSLKFVANMYVCTYECGMYTYVCTVFMLSY